ncbi:hypothetical protein EON76_00865 [bacterium]|nr:MAG: hypothetical protein EON76_00865 [bacterium]
MLSEVTVIVSRSDDTNVESFTVLTPASMQEVRDNVDRSIANTEYSVQVQVDKLLALGCFVNVKINGYHRFDENVCCAIVDAAKRGATGGSLPSDL